MDIIFLGGHVLDINLVKNIHHQQEISHLKTTLEFSKHTVILTLLTKRYLDCWMHPRHVSDVCLQPFLSPSLLTTLCPLFFVLFNCVHASCRSHDHQQDKRKNLSLSESEFQCCSDCCWEDEKEAFQLYSKSHLFLCQVQKKWKKKKNE